MMDVECIVPVGYPIPGQVVLGRKIKQTKEAMKTKQVSSIFS